MDAIYKYVSLDYLADVLERARIRIGTLEEYRDEERRNRARRRRPEVYDEREGLRDIVVELAPGSARSNADPREAVERAIARHGLDGSEHSELRVAHLDEDKVILEAASPNLYLFSASRRCERELMERLRYDACLRIEDPARFFEELSKSMASQARFLGFRDVLYEDAEAPRPEGLPPAFFKRLEFAHQAEVRALWEPLGESAEPFSVECEAAARLCCVQLER